MKKEVYVVCITSMYEGDKKNAYPEGTRNKRFLQHDCTYGPLETAKVYTSKASAEKAKSTYKDEWLFESIENHVFNLYAKEQNMTSEQYENADFNSGALYFVETGCIEID